MTTTPPYPPAPMPPPSPASPYPGRPPAPEKRKNTVGLIAIIVAVVGFVFACIPGALIVGWILLPIAFILGIVGVCQAGKTKGTSVAATIVAVVGTVVGFIVFLAVVSDAVDESFDDAFGGGDVSVATPAAPGPAGDSENGEAASTDQGTRTNPYPLGSVITDGDWQVTVNSVTADANDAVATENSFNDPAPAGSQYLLANVTVTYTGTNPQGETPFATISYVTADGNTVNSYDSMTVAPDALDTLSPLFQGASTTGNLVFTVPAASATQGTLAVEATMFADKVFVAVG
ncbi:DUF4352 domain-containing protein [Nocardia sp. NPDC003345]